MVVLAATGAAAEWLRRPAWIWVGAVGVMLVASLTLLRPVTGWRRQALAVVLVLLGVVMASAEWQLSAIERHWPEQRQRRITAASERLAGDLHAAYHRAERLAQDAVATAGADREAAFQILETLVPPSGPEMSIVMLDVDGLPWAWAGRHRLPPIARGDSIGSRATGYYVELEARRHTSDGRTAIAGVLIWAHPAVPDRGRSLAELFRARTEVGLTVYPPNTAPDSADVFDYEEPTTAGPRLLFSVRPVPPEQGTAKELAYDRGSRGVTWLVLAALALGMTIAARPMERIALLSALVWLAVRAPGRVRAGPGAVVLARDLLPAVAGTAVGLIGRPGAGGHAPHDRRRLALASRSAATLAGSRRRRRPPARVALSHQQPGPGHHAAGRRRFHRPLVELAARAHGVRGGAHRADRRALSRSCDRHPSNLVASRRRSRDRAGGFGHRHTGLEPARRMAGLVHLPLDAGAPARDTAGPAVGGHHRDRARRGQLVRAGDLGRGAGRPGPGRAARRGAARERAGSLGGAPARAVRGGAEARSRTGVRLGDVRPLERLGARRPGLSGTPGALVGRRRTGGRAGARFTRSAAVAALDDGAGPRAGRVAARHAGAPRPRRALRAHGAGRSGRGDDRGRRPAFGVGGARPSRSPAQSRESRSRPSIASR